MRALVIYESVFGNGRALAEEVAAGLSTTASGEIVVVDVTSVEHAPVVIDRGIELVVVGAPNHAFGLPTARSRQDARSRAPHAMVSTRGVREWLEQVTPQGAATRAAVWDTRMAHPGFLQTVDHASSTIRRGLRRARFRMLTQPEHFLVEDMEGPLADGELQRARAWGADLAERMFTVAASSGR